MCNPLEVTGEVDVRAVDFVKGSEYGENRGLEREGNTGPTDEPLSCVGETELFPLKCGFRLE